MKPMLFGQYCLLERISVGGMAEVFRAKPFDAPEFRGYLALKKILPHLAEDDQFIKMFVDEAKLTVQLQHPNIVRIFELGRFQSSYYILMEFISGRDLLGLQKTMRKRKETLGVSQSLFIAREMARGLDYAHHKADANGQPLNIIHRDVSPQNVLIDYRGHVKVIDFGIAKAAVQSTRTQVGVLKGKMGYMSPEQVRGEQLDHRSDVFAIGAVLWEMLTNRRLFHADNEFDTMALVRDAKAEPPSTKKLTIPPEVDQIVMRALTRHPADRYSSAGAFADAIDHYLATHMSYTSDDLSLWMREVYAEELVEERDKRLEFDKIRTASDVRRVLFGEGQPQAPPSNGQQQGSTDIWDADILPAQGEDLHQFAAQHTMIQAGGFDVSQFDDSAADELATIEDSVRIPPHMLEGTPAPMPANTPAPGRPASGGFAAEGTRPGANKAGPPKAAVAIVVVCLLLLLGGVGAIAVYLVTDTAPAAPTAASGTMVVNVTPPTGLEILVDGVKVADASPYTGRDLAAGPHVVEVRHPEFESSRQTVDVPPGEILPVDIKLAPAAPKVGTIALRLPDGIEGLTVWVDGIQKEAGNDVFELDAGKHLIEVLAEGHGPWSRTVNLQGGMRKESRVDLLPSKFDLRVEAAAGASVRVGSQRFRGTDVATGLDAATIHDVSVTVRDQGISTWKSSVGWPELGRGTLKVDFNAKLPASRRASDFGHLQATSGETWWEVLIDGVSTRRTTPITFEQKIPITAGDHTITFKRGDITHDRKISIQKGETFIMREKLDLELPKD